MRCASSLLLLLGTLRAAHGSHGSTAGGSSSEGTAADVLLEEKPLLSIQLSTSVNDVIHDYA